MHNQGLFRYRHSGKLGIYRKKTMINNYEKEMHEKYSDMYNHYYNNNGTIAVSNVHLGPSFTSQLQCDEWSTYVQGRQNGTIKCPHCGK